MTGAATDLAALGAQIEWPDAEAAADARAGAETAGGRGGRLAELTEWLAGAQGRYPPRSPVRTRLLVLGRPTPAVTELAATLGVGVRGVEPLGASGTEAGPAAAVEAGVALADDEVDSGTDLLVLAGPGSDPAAAVVVALLTGAEPVALLPRGAAAVDTGSWIALATRLRDTRHAVAELRDDPDALLARLAHPGLATAVGLVLGAAARRTPVVLDGVTAVVAGVLAADVQARAARWWQVADRDPDPVHARAVAELEKHPLLDLGTSSGDGTAGLLAVPVLRAACAGAEGAPT